MTPPPGYSIVKLGLSFIERELFGFEVGDEVGVFCDLGLSQLVVDGCRSRERLAAVGVEDEQVAHDDASAHFDHATGHEVGVMCVADRSDCLYGLDHLLGHCSEIVFEALKLGTHLNSCIRIDE